ncbi:MAG: Gfo/Idh/MocA family oxidoreductase [Chthoniobacteraceae bacterium]
MKTLHTSRRTFIKGLSTAAAGGIVFPNLLLRADDTPAGKKIGVAAIGCGGKGESDIAAAARGNEVVAICDVDANTLATAAKKYPNARTFSDFRKMIDEVKSIEACTVSTPDHAHYPAAMHSMAAGKHVCVQKPLTNTLWEAQQLQLAAKKKGVITQMGNQGHTYDENRMLKEWLDAGVVGKLKEIHVWTNRPIWPQGDEVKFKPTDVPAFLDWQAWLAATPDHAFSEGIHPFKWRGFIEWGAGAIGDMGCHNIDPIFYALDLGLPPAIDTDTRELTDIAWPAGATIRYHYKSHPKVGDLTLTWYEGKNADGSQNLPAVPEVLGDQKFGEVGFLIVGSDGVIYNKADQCRNPKIYPESRAKDFLANPPDKKYPRSPKVGEPQEEWTLAIKNGKPFDFMSQFDYSVPLTELCLLGGLAMRVGKPIEWDAEKFEVVGMPDAAKYIKRPKYRAGWEYSADKI